ncbi:MULTISPECIES: Holliday junction resolvase RecU [unclassified Massilimicrobiota]|uniref:Holliday junction resolvase RecU n=1 Tax=unclassified Massilimicrobiota TaxID=2619866 RepID=UPI000B39A5DE|nr:MULTISPECIES: Holliday junction resolvase RecU [unclassified Massilimicrobiota]NJE45021.1 Holliday junction resolvase RecU [Massilimicrobiota sp. SW1139]OUQ29350.1 Holliday junction resolvase RecU [Massilimicrobiota sp. An134]
MVNYPNMKRSWQSSTLSTHDKKHYTAHRGMSLEEDITLSNQYYLSHDIAVIYKKPTPIQIVKVDYPRREAAKIVEAYYKTPSTTDYNGLYRGKYVDFEAKETKVKTFPFANISKHQIDHLQKIINHGGIAFVIIAFTSLNEVYLIDASHIINDYYHSQRKSITYEKIKNLGHLIPQGYQPRLDYLKVVDDWYFKEDE